MRLLEDLQTAPATLVLPAARNLEVTIPGLNVEMVTLLDPVANKFDRETPKKTAALNERAWVRQGLLLADIELKIKYDIPNAAEVFERNAEEACHVVLSLPDPQICARKLMKPNPHPMTVTTTDPERGEFDVKALDAATLLVEESTL